MKRHLLLVCVLLMSIYAYGQNNVYGKKVVGLDSLVADTIRARTQAVPYIVGFGAGIAGSNQELQFNNSGVFGASSNLIWDGDGLEVDNIRLNSFTIRPSSSVNAAITVRGGSSGDTDGFVSPKGSAETSNGGGVSFGTGSTDNLTLSSAGNLNLPNGTLTVGDSLVVDTIRARTQAVPYIEGFGTGIAGSNTEIQYNDNGVFGASSGLVWDQGNTRIQTEGLFVQKNQSGVTQALIDNDTDGTGNGAGIVISGNTNNMTINSYAPSHTTFGDENRIITNGKNIIFSVDNNATDLMTLNSSGSVSVEDITLNGSTVLGNTLLTVGANTALNLTASSGNMVLNASGDIIFTPSQQINANSNDIENVNDITAVTATIDNISFQDSLIVVDGVTSMSFDAENNVSIPNGILEVGSVGWSGTTGQSSEIQMEYGQIHTRANSDNDIRIAGGIRNDGTDWDHISTTKGSLGILGKNGLSLYHTTSSSGTATLGNALTFNNDGSDNWNIETDNNIYFQENTAGTTAVYLRDGGTALTTGQQRQIVAQGQGSSTTHASSIGVYKNGSFGNLTGFWFADENDGTDHWTWYDNSGDLRTSSSIGNVGSTTGTVIGTQTSDARLKENIRDNPYGLETIKSLETHQYEKFGETELGFMAQEVDLVIPRSESKAVYDSGEPINGDTINTQLNMDYSQIIPILVKAVQEQQAQIDSLKTLIGQ